MGSKKSEEGGRFYRNLSKQLSNTFIHPTHFQLRVTFNLLNKLRNVGRTILLDILTEMK